MKKDYLAALPIVAIVGVMVALAFKPLPSAPKTTTKVTYTAPAETKETESFEQFIREQGQIQNEMLIAQVESLHNAVNHPTSEETESAEEIITEEVKVPIWEPYEFLPLSADVQQGIKNACDDYGVAFDLIIAICRQESSLNPTCVGDNGKAFGLGQIREEYWTDTAISLGLYDWKTDAVQNATMVCYLMSRQMNTYHHTIQESLNIYRHGVMDDITEPDGLTYYEHTLRNLEWLQNGGK